MIAEGPDPVQGPGPSRYRDVFVGERHVRKMLRRMGGGEPVQATTGLGTTKGLARLAFYAEQFGYEYVSAQQLDKKYAIRVVPARSSAARARAAENWVRYPGAAQGGALPPLDDHAVAVLNARIGFELATRFTEKQMFGLTAFGFTGLAIGPWIKFGLLVGGTLWATLMALIPVLLVANRRYRARNAALLEGAGFTAVTDPDGRPRYLPPVGRAD
ncbi:MULTISPECIES: hypothetical protein [unclassified Streptomyces]|uniref:hypothetical protein n=1 Tax=unclassified Streptomyces TaxID=2593676 RepID=UPI0036EB3D9B